MTKIKLRIVIESGRTVARYKLSHPFSLPRVGEIVHLPAQTIGGNTRNVKCEVLKIQYYVDGDSLVFFGYKEIIVKVKKL